MSERIYKYIWTARKGSEFFSGTIERTYKEMVDIHGTTNLVHLVREWNRLAKLQLTIKPPEGIPNIIWTYYTI